MKNLEGFGPEDKPQPKRKRGSQDRFAFHQCFHADAWTGLFDLDDGEVGVYWRIILLMYIRRAALPLDYGWLAGQCNIPHQRCRARCEALEGKGRIIIDREQRLIYDERAMRELVAAERFSQAQTDRAKQRGKAKEAKPHGLKVIKGDLGELSPANANLVAGLGVNVSAAAAERSYERGGERGGERPPLNDISARLSAPQDQALSVSPAHANHIHNHIDNPKSLSPASGAAQPSLRGGGPPNEARKRRQAAIAALDVLKGGGAEPDEGFEGGPSMSQNPASAEAENWDSDDPAAEPGDRKAVRT